MKVSQPQILALRALSELGGKATGKQVYEHNNPIAESDGRQFMSVHRTLRIISYKTWTRRTEKTIQWWTVWEITDKGRTVLASQKAAEPAGLFRSEEKS